MGNNIMSFSGSTTSSSPIISGGTDFSVTVTSTGTACVKDASGTEECVWYRVGPLMHITVTLAANTIGTPGSGTYKFLIPDSQSADLTNLRTVGGGTPPGTEQSLGPCCAYDDDTGHRGIGVVQLSDSTHLILMMLEGTFNKTAVSGAKYGFRSDYVISFSATIPISGWT